MKKRYAGILTGLALFGLACTTKVSEWVLLNAPANRYTLVYFYKSLPGENTNHQNSALKESMKNANINFTSEQKNDISQPYYALYYGGRVFARYPDVKSMNNLSLSSETKDCLRDHVGQALCNAIPLHR
jgi:hypothetical protein